LISLDQVIKHVIIVLSGIIIIALVQELIKRIVLIDSTTSSTLVSRHSFDDLQGIWVTLKAILLDHGLEFLLFTNSIELVFDAFRQNVHGKFLRYISILVVLILSFAGPVRVSEAVAGLRYCHVVGLGRSLLISGEHWVSALVSFHSGLCLGGGTTLEGL